MRVPRSRSLGLATALTALALGAAVAPARATSTVLTVDAPGAVAVDPAADADQHSGIVATVRLRVNLSNHPAPATGKITVDLTPLQGIATAAAPFGCSIAAQTLTCDNRYLSNGSTELQFQLGGPGAGARPAGSTAVLRSTAAFDGQTATADTKVTLGGSRLGVVEPPMNTGLKPGDTWTPEIKVANQGQLPASQLYFTFVGGMELAFQPRFSNCRYGSSDTADVVLCEVRTAVAPGGTVTLDPIAFKVGADAYYPYEDVTVDSAAPDLTGWLGTFHFTPGPADAPRLTVGRPEDSTVPNDVLDFHWENGGSLSAKVPNTADFVASGSWTPKAGTRQGRLTVGLANNGPASINWRSGDLPAQVRVQLPDRAALVAKPDNCVPASQDPAAHTFDCRTTPYIKNGYRASFDFTVEADPAAALTAEVTLPSLDDSNQETGMPWDPDKTNNAVTVALGAEASTGSPSPRPGTPGNGNGTTPSPSPSTYTSAPAPAPAPSTTPSATPAAPAATGTDLAATGSDGNGTLLALGLGAVGLGTAAVLVARRKRGARA